MHKSLQTLLVPLIVGAGIDAYAQVFTGPLDEGQKIHRGAKMIGRQHNDISLEMHPDGNLLLWGPVGTAR